MKQIKKRYIIVGGLLLLLFLGLFFLSTIAKNYLVKNSETLIGRRIQLKELHINYLKVAIRAKEFVMYEQNKVDTFAAFKELYVNFQPWKLLHNEYAFSAITLDSAFVSVTQNGEAFNFDDLVPPAQDTISTEESVEPNDSDPLHFSVRNIHLLQGRIHYYDQLVDNLVMMENLNLNLPLIAWNSEESQMGVDFRIGAHGAVSLGANVDHRQNKYLLSLDMDSIGINAATNYLKEYLNVGAVNGFLHTNLRIHGDMAQVMDLIISGDATLDAFEMTATNGETLISATQFFTEFDSLDIDKSYYKLGNIRVEEPRLYAKLEKDGSNIEKVFLPLMEEDSTTIESKPESLPEDSTVIKYHIDSIMVNNGVITLADLTLNRAFKYEFKAINTAIGAIDENADNIPVSFSINMNDNGMFSGTSHFSLEDPYRFDFDGHLKKLQLMSFSPYTEYHIGRPITQGDFTYKCQVNMTKKKMENQNDVRIEELEFGDKTGDTTATNTPIRLGLYLLKDPNDVIAFNLPVTGNPSDPEFRLGKIIWKAFMNFLIKTASSPFKALSSLAGTNPESLETLPFDYMQDSLGVAQRKTLDKIYTIITKKPDLVFSFSQQTDPMIEKEHLAVREVKRRMLAATMPLNNTEDSLALEKRLLEINDEDEAFNAYMAQYNHLPDSLSMGSKCYQLVGEETIGQTFTQLISTRNALITHYLEEEKGIARENFEITTADLKNIPEELKSPKYKVEVTLK
ncbi:DUF748 domain-containing protein [Marinilabiliaceae bacterium JC017]|nr:DUF748 domain-containing protein [Marinilabiliaceae bacterium JC017]